MTMNRSDGYHGQFIVATVLFCVVFLFVVGFWPPAPRPHFPRPSESIGLKRRFIERDMTEISELLSRLREGHESEMIDLMAAVRALLHEGPLREARREEKYLFPLVEGLGLGGSNSGIAAFRAEHRLLECWTQELETLTADPFPDNHAFLIRGERILGLLAGHLDGEARVLLPLIDRVTTPEEFHREIASRWEVPLPEDSRSP
jgi:hypothetical protein